MDVTGRVAVTGSVDFAVSIEIAGFDGIGIRSGPGMSSIPPHTRNKIAATVENETTPAGQVEPCAGLLACSDGSGMLSASFNNRCRGSCRSESALTIPGIEVKSGSRLPSEPLA